jgi:hypothetical protein
MSLAIAMAVTASCAVFVSISQNCRSQKGMVDRKTQDKRVKPQMPRLRNSGSAYPRAQVSSRTHVEISLWSSVP